MKTRTMIVGLGVALAAAQPVATLANGIEAIAFDGSGCPSGTVGQSISSDRRIATLIFDNFIADVGPNVAEEENVRVCNITFTLLAADAFVADAQSRGYVQLDSGVAAVQHQHLIQAKQGLAQADFAGPVARDYVVASQGALRRQAGNSQSFTVQLKIEVDGDATGRGQMTIDSFDIQLGP